jgi:hypothetical protein
MPYTNLLGEREALTQNSEDYGSKIVEYMKKRGYVLVGDSSIDGSLSDLIFKRPLADGQKETKVEVKFSDLSLYDTSFLQELGKHFITYMNRPINNRFFLKIFVRKSKASGNWKKVFEKGDNIAIEQLMVKIESKLSPEDQEDFKKFSFDDFVNFISDCHAIQAGYLSLIQKIGQLVESSKFDVNQNYLQEKENIIQTKETLTANTLKVISFPKDVWIAKAKKITDMKKFWQENFEELLYLSKKHIISLTPIIPIRNIYRYIDETSVEKIPFKVWFETDDEETVKILKNLIKKYIIHKGKQMEMRYDSKLNCLYYPHKVLKREIQKVKGRKVSRVFYGENGKVNFVEHYGITVGVLFLNREFYVILDHIRLFTNDGYEILREKSAKALHYKFTRKFAFNDVERSKFFFWNDLFSFKNRTLSYKVFFRLSDPITIESPVRTEGGEHYDKIDEYDTSLLDFFEEEDENGV